MTLKTPTMPKRYQTDHRLIAPLFVWPAMTPAQAFTNEWLHDAIYKIRGLNYVSISTKVKLELLNEMTAQKRDNYMEEVYQNLQPDDNYHPENLEFHALDIGGGKQFFGKQADLLRAAAEIGLSPDRITPITHHEVTHERQSS